MKNNDHRQSYSFAAQFTLQLQARQLTVPARRDLLSIFRRFTASHPPRTFWELDQSTGAWHLL